jgi:hypothetical protein
VIFLLDTAVGAVLFLAARALVYRVLWPRFGVKGEQLEATMRFQDERGWPLYRKR